MTTTLAPTTTVATVDEALVRQAPLSLTLPRAVAIIGVGGVGSWIAMFLALAGVQRLFLWDMDTVSPTNLNRLPLDPGSIGEHKSVAMQRLIARLKPSCEVIAIFRWTPEAQAEIGDLPDWIVACTDTWRSRQEIHAWARAQVTVRYIEASAEGEYGGCTGEPAMFATEDEVNPGYASVPVWIGPCVTSAYMVCAHILHDATLGPESYRIGWRPEGKLDFQQPIVLA